MNPKFEKPADPSPSAESLEEEIAIVREEIRQLHKRVGQDTEVNVLLRILDSTSSASARLVSLLRAQQRIAERAAGGSSLTERMNQIVVDIAREKGLIP